MSWFRCNDVTCIGQLWIVQFIMSKSTIHEWNPGKKVPTNNSPIGRCLVTEPPGKSGVAKEASLASPFFKANEAIACLGQGIAEQAEMLPGKELQRWGRSKTPSLLSN